MALEEFGRYNSVGNHKIRLGGFIDHYEMKLYYGFEIIKILGMDRKSNVNINEILENEQVISGLTDNLIMPSGVWHQASGKCLGGNTGGSVGREKLDNFLKGFDISL